MRRKPSYLTIAAALAAAACSAAALAGGEAGKLELRDLGSRFVGYTTASAASGSLDVLNPLFVQYLLPARKRHEYPIVFIHGGGGQGTDWLETPDGRDGWVDYFVADGWDVYVVDRPGHTSGADVERRAMMPELPTRTVLPQVELLCARPWLGRSTT